MAGKSLAGFDWHSAGYYSGDHEMPIQFNTGIAAPINRNAASSTPFSMQPLNGQVTGRAVEPKSSLFSLTAQLGNSSTALTSLGMRTSFMAAAQGQTRKLADQLADLRDALKKRQNISTETISNAEKTASSNLTGVQIEERFGLRERIEKRDAFVEEGRFADRAVFETRNITEEQVVYETRNITETRDIFEDRAVYGTAEVNGSRNIAQSGFEGWDDAGILEGEKFSVRVGSGVEATIVFHKNEQIKIDFSDGSASQKITFVDGGGAWRTGLLDALNRIEGLKATLSNGQLQLQAEETGQDITLRNVKGTSLSDLGLSAGTYRAPPVGSERVKVGEEQVVVGQERVATGTENVVIGQERVQVGTERVQVSTHRFKIGTEDSVVQERVKLGSAVRTAPIEETLAQTWNAPESNRKVAVSDKVERLAEDARETLQSLRESWTAAGMTLKLDAEILGIEKGFVQTLTSEEAIRDRISTLNRGLNQVEEGGGLRGATATTLQADKPAAGASVIEKFDQAAEEAEQNKQDNWIAESLSASNRPENKPELASRASEAAARVVGGYAQNGYEAKRKDKAAPGRLERVI